MRCLTSVRVMRLGKTHCRGYRCIDISSFTKHKSLFRAICCISSEVHKPGSRLQQPIALKPSPLPKTAYRYHLRSRARNYTLPQKDDHNCLSRNLLWNIILNLANDNHVYMYVSRDCA